MGEGPYRESARPAEATAPGRDRESLALAALAAAIGVLPVIGDLASGRAIGGASAVGMLVIAAASRHAWTEARRTRRTEDTWPRGGGED